MSDEARARAAESTLGQFQSLFKNMPEGCALHEVVTDEQGRPIDYVFLDINPAFERLTGLRKADVVGRRLTEVLPGLEPFWFETYGRVAPSGEPVVFERELPAPLGRWYQVCAYQPGPGRFATIFLDVSAHHDLEKRLREIAAKYSSLFNTTSDGIWIHDLEGRILEVNDAYCRMSGYARNELVGMPVSRLEATETPEEAAARIRKVVESGGHDRFESRHRRKDGSVFDVDIAALFFRSRGGRIAIFARDITERKRAEAELRESRSKYRSLIETTNDFIWEMDALGKYTYCSPQMEKRWGFKPDEMIGRTLFDVMPPEERAGVAGRFAELAMSPQPFSGLESTAVVTGGRHIRIETSGVPFFDDHGRLLGFRGISRDITERKRAEDERNRLAANVQQERDRLRALIDSIADEIWFADKDKTLTLVNRAVVEGFGMDDGEGREVEAIAAGLEIYRPDGTPRPPGEAPLLRALRGETVKDQEEIIRTPATGELRYRLVTAAPVRDTQGSIVGSVTVVRDITERHRVAEALRLSEARLKLAQESAGAGVWDWDIPSGRLDGSEGLFRLFGLDPLKQEATFEAWRSVLHPEDRALAEERIMAAVANRTPLSSRYRIVLPSGEVRWINALGSAVYGEGGEPLRMSGICLDITGLKQAEERLEQGNRRIKEMLASIQDDFFVLDRDWRFRFVSRRFTSRIGKEPKDLVGRVIWDMFPKHLGTIYEENLRAAMEKREIRRFEFEGRYTQAWYSMAVFPSADGITVLGVDITKRKKDEEALQASEARFRSVLDNSRDVVYRFNMRTGRFEYVSPSCEKVVGYPADPLAGLDGQAALEMIHPDDRKAFLDAVARCEETGDAEIEYRQRGADGAYRWLSNHISVSRDRDGRPLYRDGNIRDVTERKEAEVLRQALIEQERLRLGAAVDQAPDAVVMLDLDGTIRYANAAFGFVNKMAKDETKGRSYFDEFTPRALADQMRQALAAGRAWQGSLARPIRGGRPVELEVALSAVTDTAGAVVGGLVTEKDVTYEMALQRQLRQGQKMEALGTLAGGIAHDFNNILNPIFISVELALLEPSLDPAVRSHLEVGLKAAERGRDLVKQVIAFSRQKERERKPFKAAPVVRESVNFLRVSLPSTIEIRSEVRDETGAILGDPAQLQQIVVNLSSNAAYAMRQSGGVLTVNLDGVEADDELAGQVPGLKPGPYLRLTVADTGTGMTPGVVARLFDPFFTTKGPGEGSGMGLPVVDGIVRDYGGGIAVMTEEGRGSTFTVYLPREECGGSPPESIPDDLPRGTGRILLIDDEEVQIYSIRRMLEKLGYEVVALTDGREAVERFRSEPRRFDLVITDQTMPRLTGMQVAGELLRSRPDLPIILCTGYSEVVDARKARALGIREFLMKPYSVREMAEVVRRTLAGRS